MLFVSLPELPSIESSGDSALAFAPHLLAFAQASARWELLASSESDAAHLASVMTGVLPSDHGLLSLHQPVRLKPDFPTLAQELQSKGLQTRAVMGWGALAAYSDLSAGEELSGLSLQSGFDSWRAPLPADDFGDLSWASTFEGLEQGLALGLEQPTFLWAHFAKTTLDPRRTLSPDTEEILQHYAARAAELRVGNLADWQTVATQAADDPLQATIEFQRTLGRRRGQPERGLFEAAQSALLWNAFDREWAEFAERTDSLSGPVWVVHGIGQEQQSDKEAGQEAELMCGDRSPLGQLWVCAEGLEPGLRETVPSALALRSLLLESCEHPVDACTQLDEVPADSDHWYHCLSEGAWIRLNGAGNAFHSSLESSAAPLAPAQLKWSTEGPVRLVAQWSDDAWVLDRDEVKRASTSAPRSLAAGESAELQFGEPRPDLTLQVQWQAGEWVGLRNRGAEPVLLSLPGSSSGETQPQAEYLDFEVERISIQQLRACLQPSKEVLSTEVEGQVWLLPLQKDADFVVLPLLPKTQPNFTQEVWGRGVLVSGTLPLEFTVDLKTGSECAWAVRRGSDWVLPAPARPFGENAGDEKAGGEKASVVYLGRAWDSLQRARLYLPSWCSEPCTLLSRSSSGVEQRLSLELSGPFIGRERVLSVEAPIQRLFQRADQL